MDMGRESRWEKDAMTVEIVFALVTFPVRSQGDPCHRWTQRLVDDSCGQDLQRRRLLHP